MSTYRRHAGKSLDDLEQEIILLEKEKLQLEDQLESARKTKFAWLPKIWTTFVSKPLTSIWNWVSFSILLESVPPLILIFAVTFVIKSCITYSTEAKTHELESQRLLFSAAETWASEQKKQVLDLRCTHPFNDSGRSERDDYYTCYVYGHNRNNEMLIEAISCNPAKKFCFKLAR